MLRVSGFVDDIMSVKNMQRERAHAQNNSPFTMKDRSLGQSLMSMIALF